MSWSWAFYVDVKYEAPDQYGKLRQWGVTEKLIGIGSGGMPEHEARKIAGRLLDTDARTRRYVLGHYPDGATATLGAGYTYEEHLPDRYD
jgi:hypothetical protein